MATLLATIREVCARLAQPMPSTVIGSTDKQVTQMLALLQEGLDNLSGRGAWQQLTNEYTFATVAAEDQGTLQLGFGTAPVAFNGLRYFLPDTFWDRTNKLPLCPPMDAQDWQAMKAWVINGPRYQFRLRANHFLVNPTPSAGWTWAFEYISSNSISNAAGTVWYSRFVADTDILLLPDQIVQMDLRWRWKKEKNLPYAQDFQDCEKLIVDALGRDAPKKDLRLDCNEEYGAPRPTIVISPGNWPV